MKDVIGVTPAQRLLLLGAAISVLWLAGGCKTVNTLQVNQDGQKSYKETDWNLGRIAQVGPVRKTRQGTLLHVQVDVTNQTSSPETFLFRFAWFDGDGMEVHTPYSTWQPKIIEGGQTVSLGGVAPESRVTDCKLELRRQD